MSKNYRVFVLRYALNHEENINQRVLAEKTVLIKLIKWMQIIAIKSYFDQYFATINFTNQENFTFKKDFTLFCIYYKIVL
jgi:hypothetical protein